MGGCVFVWVTLVGGRVDVYVCVCKGYLCGGGRVDDCVVGGMMDVLFVCGRVDECCVWRWLVCHSYSTG